MTDDERLQVALDKQDEALAKGKRIAAEDVFPDELTLQEQFRRESDLLEQWYALDETDPLGETETLAGCPYCHCDNSNLRRIDDELYHCQQCEKQFSRVDTQSKFPTDKRLLQRFQLTRQLGQGAYGEVWEAIDLKLERRVALKIPRAQILQAGQSEEFLREARFASSLSHDHIVQVLDVYDEGEFPVIVSEYIAGRTLAKQIELAPLAATQAARHFRDLAHAVQVAHTKDIVHRDIKPGNVMISEAGRAMLLDFGVAVTRPPDVIVSGSGQELGTIAYMAPEQLREDRPTSSARSDIYSLGVTLYEALTGERPFRGDWFILPAQIQNEEPLRPRRLNHTVPKDLETIVLKCMEKSPERRYASASELAQDLERFLNHEPIQARPAGAIRRTMKFVRRQPALSGLYAAILLIAIAGPIAAIYQAKLREDANEAREVAEEERTIAKEERYRALDTIDNYVDVVSNSALAREPRLKPLAEEILQDSLANLQDRAADSNGSREETLVYAKTLVSTAKIYVTIGGNQDAEKPLQDAVERFKSAIRSGNKTDEVLGGQADALELLAQVYRNLEETDQALKSILEAKAIWDSLAEQNPGNLAYRLRQIQVWVTMARMAAYDQQGDLVKQRSDKRLQLSRALRGDFPESDEARHALAEALIMESYERSREEALSLNLEAVSLMEEVRERQPDSISYRSSYAHALRAVATNLHLQRRHTSANDYFRQAIELFEGLVDRFPFEPRYQEGLNLCYRYQARLWIFLGEDDIAVETAFKAIDSSRRLLFESPYARLLHGNALETYNQMGILLRNKADFNRSLEVCDDMERVLKFRVKTDPESLIYQEALASVYMQRGVLHRAYSQTEGDLDIAVSSYESAMAGFRKVLEQEPGLWRTWGSLARVTFNRGNAYLDLGQEDEALASYNEAISVLDELISRKPSRVRKYKLEKETYRFEGPARYFIATKQYDQAVATREGVIKKLRQMHKRGLETEKLAEKANKMAWWLVTDPSPEIRNAGLGLRYAVEAAELTEYADPQYLDTLAAAYALSGDFAKAVEWQNKAIDLADEQGLAKFEKQFQDHLVQYESGQPLAPINMD